MKQGLDRIVFLSFSLVFAGVLTIGGASLYLIQNMMDKTQAIAEESQNVDFINHLHNKTYGLILAIHHMMVHADDRHVRQTQQLIDEVERDVTAYLRHEAESPYPESEAEITLLHRLHAILMSLKAVAEASRAADGPPGRMLDAALDAQLDRHAVEIEGLIGDINRLHFEIINRKLDKTRRSMSVVFNLFALCSLIGLALLNLGYRLHSKHVVQPLKQLAGATHQIAEGNLAVRVASDSRTEIGQLYQAFNTMAERLQSHELELLALNRDLEDKVRARTRELEAAHAELLHFEKMAMLGQIATSVNHEIRTPLNALSMNVQLIRKALDACGQTLDASCRARQANVFERIEVVDREIIRISDMLEEFVRYARLAPPELVELDLNRVVGYVADMINERAEHSRVTLRLELATPPPRVEADENKLIQALVNLCTNAFHAMPEGGVLTLRTTAEADRARIVVADTGIGIPAADLERIFLPFFTSKASGMGFGLSIVQRVVEEHGGRITCRSTLGAGSEFSIELPRVPQRATDDRT